MENLRYRFEDELIQQIMDDQKVSADLAMQHISEMEKWALDDLFNEWLRDYERNSRNTH